MDTINNVGLIFGIGISLVLFLIYSAIYFVVARYFIKFSTSKAIIKATPNYQPSVFVRLFLKLNFVVYYLFIILFGLYGFLGLCVYGIDKIPPINIFSFFNGYFYAYLGAAFMFLMPYVKALCYYKLTGFKCWRVYVMVFFVHYVCWCFMLILPLTEFLGKKVNPNILHLLIQPFTASL